MSGLRPVEMDQFYHRLHDRGLSTTELARMVGRNACTVSRVLSGSRRKGPLWRRLSALLTEEERQLLHVAECSAWNKKRVENRPKWTPEKTLLLTGAQTS